MEYAHQCDKRVENHFANLLIFQPIHMLLSIALVQINFSAGNVDANMARIAVLYKMAKLAKADLVVFSEMAVTGYPPRRFDLGSPVSAKQHARGGTTCAALTKDGPAILVGSLWCEDEALYNAVFLLEDGKISQRQP